MSEKPLTASQAARRYGVARQTLVRAAQRGDIGTKVEALGTRDGWIYIFTAAEVEAWLARDRHPGGRPKSLVLIPTPVIRAAA
jgi:hypothetical protein